MNIKICSWRDFLMNLCKKKTNIVYLFFFFGLFFLLHVYLVHYDKGVGTEVFLGFSSGNSLKLLDMGQNLAHKPNQELQNEEPEVICNQDCAEAFIDHFLFSEDENEDRDFDGNSTTAIPITTSVKKQGLGKGRGSKKKKQKEKEKKIDVDIPEEWENSSNYILPTRKRAQNQNMYKKDLSQNLSSSWTPELARLRQEVFRARSEDISKACEALNKKRGFFHVKRSKLEDNLRWVRKYNFVWCPIFKSASTTWVKNLLLLAGEKYVTDSLHRRVRELYPKPDNPRERNSVLEESMKIIIVRHPLDRLLSAYRDKMLRVRNPNDPFVKLQEKIIKQYTDPLGFKPTSSEGPSEGKSGKNQTYYHPTFSQFLLRVKNDLERFWDKQGNGQVNLHWRPYWITCGPCQVNYDVIAQVETLGPDQEYIIRELGLENVLYNSHTHASNFDPYNGTNEAAHHYFGQVPIGLLKDIIKLYQPDFQLFSYSPDIYIDLTNKT
ncbi:hypothetical protein SK128_004287 [Halocaridina rubra]|uniref:Carbohydrate sulfotransferase n=1 Tax=Halocaridina rubra TaxID=373956 RepID=A0AAN8XCA3_HALRR